ncbi:MAG: S-layer homology domain-containing protein [Clostridia bacterium]|jgi:hypothetical protein|nr:S-layer homology domain-containing protein [Clostridia bacterium]
MTIKENKFSSWIIAMTILVLLAVGSGIISFALDGSAPPPVSVNIDAASHFTANLNFVDADDPGRSTPWCPGLAKIGSVKITNGYFGAVTIKNIGVEVSNVDALYNTFVDNMHLRIRDVQANQILYNNSLSGIAHKAGAGGAGLNIAQQLNRTGSTELEFILSMLPEAGDEMQGLSAALAFQFNTEDTTNYSNNGSDNRSDTGGEGSDPAPAFLMATRAWYEDCIEALIAHEIIIPEIDGEIRPNDLITRGEAAVLVGRALGLAEDKESSPPYLDNIPEKYLGYINATSKAGVFRGYPLVAEFLPGRVFKADNHITREELFCVLVRAYDVALDGDHELNFTDKDDINPWAMDDIRAGVQKQIIGGYPDNTLKPQQFISRAEAFTLVCRLQGYHALHNVAAGGAGQ